MLQTLEPKKIVSGNASSGTYYMRKMKCPRHFLIHPSIDIYKREIVPELKNVSKSLLSSGRARNTRIARDKFGNKVLDWKKIYALEREGNGMVRQPEITGAFAIEHIWDPKHPICKMCNGRCKEGRGRVNETGIKRLNG